MARRSIRAIPLVGVVLLLMLVAGNVRAESGEQVSGRESSESVDLRSELRRQEEELDWAVGALASVGEELEESQQRVEEARSRQQDLGHRARELEVALEAQKEASARSRIRLEEQVRAAYKGRELDGLLLLFEGLFGAENGPGSPSATLQATRLLTESSRSIQDYKDTRQGLRSTLRQVQQSEAEYRAYGEESQVLVDDLQGRESEMRDLIEELGLERDRLEERLEQLEAEEAAGLLERPPATGGGDERKTRDRGEDQAGGDGRQEERERARERELEIAREDIVARPVEPIPYEEYIRLYRESAERYGFARDWYVLAAVGKIESNHGENMGPSSAGAMGPMQFLPSTWSSYGVDGNGDGTANIMDPEDAIPAAASYLRAGGAPGDWYAALFTYNRAGWYVEEVLAIAESYRRIHGDDSVGPYLAPRAAPPAETSPPSSGPAPQPNDRPEARENPREERPPEEAQSPVREPQPAEDVLDDEGNETTMETTDPAPRGATTTEQDR